MAALIVPLVYWLLPPPAESAAPAPAEVAQPHSTERGVILDPPIREDKSTPASSDIVSDKRPPDPGHLAPLSPNPESVPATTPAPPEKKPQPVPRYKVGDTFTQEVLVSRISAYRILGADIGQNVQYVFVSRLTIDKVERDGGLVVKQKVQEARFSEGDPAVQPSSTTPSRRRRAPPSRSPSTARAK